ncbi:MAG: hypothetical protein IT174_13565 [Acidobacteria bacterium]|nr:hypothetical protein [Acidobacteriota bacterium]
MKHEVPFRIIVTGPLSGVEMKIQKGRNELIGPATDSRAKKVFEFSLLADLDPSVPNFLGPFAQGPKDARFIYLNSGTSAGQFGSCWTRRAKLSLMSISKELVESVLRSPGARFETAIHGIGRDGGPICAGVKGLEWRIVEE